MPAVRQIRLSEVHVFEKVSGATVGTLLQITARAPTPEVCLRAALPAIDGVAHGVVILEGIRAGEFLADEDLIDHFAIDLSSLAEVMLSEPAPRTAGAHQNDAGNIYKVSDRNGTCFLGMAVKTHASNKIVGYARLTPPFRGHVEQIFDRLYLGKATVLELPRLIHDPAY